MTTSEISFTQREELDEDFYKGNADFHLPNGDKYKGEFIAHRNGLIWREGNFKSKNFQ